jgi:hypothetical protein
MSLIFTSWNQIAGWLRRLHALKGAAQAFIRLGGEGVERCARLRILASVLRSSLRQCSAPPDALVP